MLRSRYGIIIVLKKGANMFDLLRKANTINKNKIAEMLKISEEQNI